MLIVKSPPDEKPGSTCISFQNPLTINPEPTSNTIASATSPQTRTFRKICDAPEAVERPADAFNGSCRLPDATCNSGARPKNIPVPRQVARVNSNTFQFSVISPILGTRPALVNIIKRSPP